MKPLFLTYILLGTILITGCSNPNISAKPVSWSRNTAASGQVASGSWNILSSANTSTPWQVVPVSGSWNTIPPSGSGSMSGSMRSFGTGAISPIPEPKKCVRLFDLRVGSSQDYRRFEFVFHNNCPPQKEPRTIGFFDGEAFSISTGQKAMLTSMISDQNFWSVTWPDRKYYKSWEGKNGNISVTAWPLMQSDMDTGKTIRIGNGYSIEAVVGSILMFRIDDISEGDIKKQYEEILWTMKNGFRELPGVKGKDTFDWKSVKIASARFVSDAIQISDGNGAQKSIPVKVASSKNLAGICGQECWNNLHEICQTFNGMCQVESVSKQKVRWTDSYSTTDMSSDEHYETDIATGNTKLVKSDRTCYEDGPTKEAVPCR